MDATNEPERTELPRGTCSLCRRADVLLFSRGPHGLTNAPGSTTLTYHDDVDGVACANGGQPAGPARAGA